MLDVKNVAFGYRGYEFSGFEVSYLKEALDTVEAAAAILPHRLVGWDIAITEEGPVLLEGNIDFGFWGAQIADGGYKKNRVFRSFSMNSMGNK